MTIERAHRFVRVSLRRRWIATALVALIAAPGAISVLPADAVTNAQKQAEIKKKVSALRDEINEVSGEEAELLGRLDDINNRKADVEAKIADLQTQIDEDQRQLDLANAKLAAAQAEVERSEKALADAQAALADNTARLQAQAVDAYIGKDAAQSMSKVIIKTNDLSQASAASAYMRQIVANKRDVVEEHRELEGQARDLNKKVEKLKADAEAERQAVADHQAQLAAQKAELDGLHAQVQSEADAQNALLAEVESKRAKFEAEVASLQAQSDAIANVLRDGGTGTAVSPGRGIIASPVPGAVMTSPFGYRVHPIFGTPRLHAGQDYGVKIGTPLRAAADGVVATAGAVSGYGNYTCIKHTQIGIATCYAHQSQIQVSVGQRVTRNQIIGLSGNTGNSTGPHLHFEVRVNGNPVDPRSYL